MQHPQLTLSLGIVPSHSFETFFIGRGSANACATLKAFCNNEIEDMQLFFWGEQHVGKSHLLSAACQQLASEGFNVAYLTGEQCSHDDALQGLENSDLFCLDDVHLLRTDAEEALFHCINRCRDYGTRLLFTSAIAHDQLTITLADLKTRLSWGPIYHLQPLADDELHAAVAHMLKARSMTVGDDVIDYILRRFPRDIAQLKQLVDKLDTESMSAHRKVTIPLIKTLTSEA
jgi:DnaA family protein